MYVIRFVMYQENTPINEWFTSQTFPSKELAKKFAQTVVKGVEDGEYTLYYYLVKIAPQINPDQEREKKEKVWVVEEFTCYDHTRGGTTKTSEGFYTTKEKALAAVYDDIVNALKSDDIYKPNVVQQDYTNTNIRIFVNCRELYGTYDWYYIISEVNVDLDYYRYRDFK